MSQLELKIQSEFIKWVQNEHPFLRLNVFAVDNNSQSKIRGGLSKATGVKRGVSDLIFIGVGKVLFVEVKTDIGTQSIHQMNFQKCVTDYGHEYHLCRSVDELKELFNLTFFNSKIV